MSIADIIVWIIGALAFIGFVCQLTAGRRYGIELGHLKRAEIALAAMEQSDPIDSLISGSSVSGNSITGHRLYQVRNIVKSPAPPSVADLSLADIERDDSKFESVFPNTLISILLIAGLAGTLFSFKHIMGDFPQGTESTVVIKKWMNEAYPAFGTAFQASLFGIGGTLILLIARAFIHNRRNDLFDRLDRFTAGSLYSRFVERDATDATTLMEAGQQLLTTAGRFDTSVEKMGTFPKALTTSTAGLTDATAEMRDALGNAATTFEEFKAGFSKNGNMRQILVRLEETVIAFAQQTKSASGMLSEGISGAASVLHGAANLMKQAGDSIAGVGGKVATAGESIERSVAQLLAGNTAHAAKMDVLIQSLSGIVETTNRNQREWNEAILPAIRAMTETAGRLETSVVPLNARTDAFVKAADQMEKSAAQLLASGEAQVQQFGTSAGRIEKAIAESGANQQAFIAKTATELTAAGDAQVERLRKSASTIDRATDLTSSSHRGFLTELEPALKGLPTLAQKQTALLEQLAGIGARLRDELANLGLRKPPKTRGWKFWQR